MQRKMEMYENIVYFLNGKMMSCIKLYPYTCI